MEQKRKQSSCVACPPALSCALGTPLCLSLRRSMSSSQDYSSSTLALLAQHQFTPSNVWFLAESEVDSLEETVPGLREAWPEIRRRPRPAFPSVGFVFGRPKQPPSRVPPASAASSKALPQPKRHKAWGGLTASARESGKYTSDAAKRKQAAVSALTLVKTWAQGNHAQARASMSAEDLSDFERRFVDNFSGGASVACRINSFHHVEGGALRERAMSGPFSGPTYSPICGRPVVQDEFPQP